MLQLPAKFHRNLFTVFKVIVKKTFGSLFVDTVHKMIDYQ